MRFVWLAVAFLAFVGTAPVNAQTPVGDILDNPEQYNDTQVSVEGTVALVGDGGNYTFEGENSNQIRIRYSAYEAPSEGEQVAVEGIVSISAFNREPYITESSRSSLSGSADGGQTQVRAAWRFQTEGRVDSSPAVAGGTVYVGSYDGHLYAIDAETGEERWRFETDDDVHSSPAVARGTVYVGSFDNHLYAIDAETGEERWRFETDHDVHSSLAVVGGTVYVGSRDGRLYAIDAETGEEQWRFRTPWGMRSSPAVAGGTVYVGSADDRLYAIDAETGEQQWRFETEGDVHSSPAVAGGTVYVGSRGRYNGYIYAFE